MIGNEYLRVVGERFRLMKKTAEEAMKQVSDSALFWTDNSESNSIAAIVNHLYGHMVTNWTNFLAADGEKPLINRSNEFIHHFSGRQDMMKHWELGWSKILNQLNQLTGDDLLKGVIIRNEPHSVIEAIENHLYHYAYHVGQIVYICKHFAVDNWKSVYA
ncbi:DUF1572 family protein [Peribacillus faecalis]|nr:DUF1572 family protein [Peribacillus faecalis]